VHVYAYGVQVLSEQVRRRLAMDVSDDDESDAQRPCSSDMPPYHTPTIVGSSSTRPTFGPAYTAQFGRGRKSNLAERLQSAHHMEVRRVCV
jgi:hypothetical protein